MSSEFDLVVRNGVVFDGAGGEGFVADVGVSGGTITHVGRIDGRGMSEIDAKGKIVTPGFVDIHTHYDGQVLWEERTDPSAAHGVTTAVMGNCGVGFAPCRKGDRERLIQLMEGVEDIPEVVMSEGLPWNWESFEEYLDVVAGRARDIDVAAQLPHSCLRVYVMGERASAREVATPEDRAEMQQLAASAVRAGAIGLGTSRSIFHRDRNGVSIPTKEAGEAELHAIATGLASAGPAVIEALIDYDCLEEEFGLLKRVGRAHGLPVSFTLVQTMDQPDAWRRALELIGVANQEGVKMRGQVIGRATGLVLGLDLSFHPFSLYPTYQALAALPLARRVAEMRKPQVRTQILSERPQEPKYEALKRMLAKFTDMYVLGDPPNYEPAPEDSIAARAQRAGVTEREAAYDAILADGGKGVLFVPFTNYIEGNLDAALVMLRNPHTVLGLGDGGAHYGSICDAGYPTFMLTYWTRDRPTGERLSVGEVVKQLTSDTAGAVGLHDRGRIARGYKADLNVIDYDRLHLCAPTVKYDLPAKGRRLVQKARGYTATIVSGVTTYLDGVPTGALPGGLVRGQWRARGCGSGPHSNSPPRAERK